MVLTHTTVYLRHFHFRRCCFGVRRADSAVLCSALLCSAPQTVVLPCFAVQCCRSPRPLPSFLPPLPLPSLTRGSRTRRVSTQRAFVLCCCFPLLFSSSFFFFFFFFTATQPNPPPPAYTSYLSSLVTPPHLLPTLPNPKPLLPNLQQKSEQLFFRTRRTRCVSGRRNLRARAPPPSSRGSCSAP